MTSYRTIPLTGLQFQIPTYPGAQMLCSRINFYFLHSTKETGLLSEQHNPWCIVSYGAVPGLWFPWCVLRAEVIRWHFASWGKLFHWSFFSIQFLFSSVFGQYSFTLPMQDWIFLTHYCNFSPCPPCLCATPSSSPFPQNPTEKLQPLTRSLPLQHVPGFCPIQITKPINPHTHFWICRLALVFLSSPQTHPILPHVQYTSISHTLPLPVS